MHHPSIRMDHPGGHPLLGVLLCLLKHCCIQVLLDTWKSTFKSGLQTGTVGLKCFFSISRLEVSCRRMDFHLAPSCSAPALVAAAADRNANEALASC